jgi:hypothetical protein
MIQTTAARKPVTYLPAQKRLTDEAASAFLLAIGCIASHQHIHAAAGKLNCTSGQAYRQRPVSLAFVPTGPVTT